MKTTTTSKSEQVCEEINAIGINEDFNKKEQNVIEDLDIGINLIIIGICIVPTLLVLSGSNNDFILPSFFGSFVFYHIFEIIRKTIFKVDKIEFWEILSVIGYFISGFSLCFTHNGFFLFAVVFFIAVPYILRESANSINEIKEHIKSVDEKIKEQISDKEIDCTPDFIKAEDPAVVSEMEILISDFKELLKQILSVPHGTVAKSRIVENVNIIKEEFLKNIDLNNLDRNKEIVNEMKIILELSKEFFASKMLEETNNSLKNIEVIFKTIKTSR